MIEFLLPGTGRRIVLGIMLESSLQKKKMTQ